MSELLDKLAVTDYSAYRILVYQKKGAFELVDYFEWKKCKPILATEIDVVNLIKTELFDLYIIDKLENNSYALFDLIKESKPSAVVWFMSDDTTAETKLELYNRGVDLYIERPTNIAVLFALFTATVKNRVIQPLQYECVYTIGECYRVDNDSGYIYYTNPKNGEELAWKLGDKALKILCMLYAYKNNTVMKADIARTVYGVADDTAYTNVIRTITLLKDKLRYDKSIEIRNIYKVGYMLHIKDTE